MKKTMTSVFLWIVALIITFFSLAYQRRTGPSYPIAGTRQIEGRALEYELLRSHGGDGDQPVVIVIPDTAFAAAVLYRRYKTDDLWTRIQMQRLGDQLVAALPHQPPAGKLEYHIEVRKGEVIANIPEKENAITRFRGDVPGWALLPHVIFMSLAMLFSTRTGLQSLRKGAPLRGLVLATIALTIFGGFIFGPIVQKFAFGAYWTGIPFGADLTDNKTLIALAAWMIALLRIRRQPNARLWPFAAALVMFVIFLIPHSMHGSELDYAKMEAVQESIPQAE
ncbi:hypothetical protein JXA02_07700 [candidate division KSB1 bacterium]|nr:hypothetical protein [candidate division KSB1 bacterium]RQW06326.1 MAG: hypothetical protein EH222_08960 [candidate division KSB1 bacterium]